MSTQRTLTDHGAEPRSEFERHWGITREELERRAAARVVTASKPEERQCNECGKRVTELPDGREAGHARGWSRGFEECSQYIGGGAD
ncbi:MULTISPECIES: hypothetical protein [Halolamina]|uniref:Uncharacterized protein n=1 Tax=Halolamina pelagica TaxID=699431 RepID=A0A1I5VN63_9EURY|nr:MULTISPECIES: hypothetical protein [Halolamina]NHX37845.1 hypothetical protein [Halolamina sp. R1-12]SFQ09008.1 hypothetical protein SAMN05216277_1197 [Halolamina pelagica]